MTSGAVRRPHAWERFWFSEVPPELYAWLRISFGAIGFVSLVGLTPVSTFWPLDSLSPIPGNGLGVRAQLQALGLATAAGWVLFTVLAASFAAMTVGWRARLAVPICFLGTVVHAHWNNLPLSGAHQVLIVFLFCLMWVDSGGAWSVDPPTRSARRRTQPIWPLRLLRAQIAIIYLGSGLWKLLDAAWRDGSAIHYVANHNVFHRFPYAIPPDAAWLLTAATYATLFWELTFGLMVLHRWTRRLALAVGIVLHGAMWLLLELGPFSALMLASYLAFLDPHRLPHTFVPRFARRRVIPQPT